MTDNYVCIDNKYYDPYFILEVDEDDDLEYIIKCYKYKAKKYHPDKALTQKDKIKNEKKFKILNKCIEFIKEKRECSFINPKERRKEYNKYDKTKTKTKTKNFTNKDELNDFNDSFVTKNYKQKNLEINRESTNREISINLVKQFEKESEFKRDKFNLIFDYNLLKNKEKNEDDSKQLIHYTTDGFYGYNTSELDNYAIVRTFNGLLISDDLLDKNENTNYGNNYADYNDIYKNQIKNPNKIVKLTEKDIKEVKKYLKQKKSNIKKASSYVYSDEEIESDDENLNKFDKEQYNLYKKNLAHLIKQQEKDEKIIFSSGVYDNNLLQDAKDGVLDMSPSLLRALDEHYKFKRLN